jgi:hypothetical protein
MRDKRINVRASEESKRFLKSLASLEGISEAGVIENVLEGLYFLTKHYMDNNYKNDVTYCIDGCRGNMEGLISFVKVWCGFRKIAEKMEHKE